MKKSPPIRQKFLWEGGGCGIITLDRKHSEERKVPVKTVNRNSHGRKDNRHDLSDQKINLWTEEPRFRSLIWPGDLTVVLQWSRTRPIPIVRSYTCRALIIMAPMLFYRAPKSIRGSYCANWSIESAVLDHCSTGLTRGAANCVRVVAHCHWSKVQLIFQYRSESWCGEFQSDEKQFGTIWIAIMLTETSVSLSFLILPAGRRRKKEVSCMNSFSPVAVLSETHLRSGSKVRSIGSMGLGSSYEKKKTPTKGRSRSRTDSGQGKRNRNHFHELRPLFRLLNELLLWDGGDLISKVNERFLRSRKVNENWEGGPNGISGIFSTPPPPPRIYTFFR